MPVQLGKWGANDSTGWTSITPAMDSAWNGAGKYPAAWQYHQGISPGTGTTGYPPATPPSGYPAATGDGTRFIFVHPSGSDSNIGTLASPLFSFPAAVSGFRATAPDWVLLGNGLSYPTTCLTFNLVNVNGPVVNPDANGYSSATPQLIGNCDFSASMLPPVVNPGTGGALPLLDCRSASCPGGNGVNGYLQFGSGMMLNFALVGINFTGHTWGDQVFGIFVGNTDTGPNFFLVEGCYFTSLWQAADYQDFASLPNYMIFRRNVISKNYTTGYQGPVGANLLFHENIVSRSPKQGGGTEHNLYMGSSEMQHGTTAIAHPAEFRGNMIAYGSGGEEFRTGSYGGNNLFLREQVCYHSYGIQVSGNYITDGDTSIEPTLACGYEGPGSSTANGYPVPSFQSEWQNKGSYEFKNFIFANGSSSSGGAACRLTPGIQAASKFTNGIMYNVSGGIILLWPPEEKGIAQGGASPPTITTPGSGYPYYARTAFTSAQLATNNTGSTPGGTAAWQFTGTLLTVSSSNHPIYGQYVNGAYIWLDDIAVISGSSPPAPGLYYVTSQSSAAYVTLPELTFNGTNYSGNIYWCWPGQNLAGGTGASASADIYVNASGQVKAFSCGLVSVYAGVTYASSPGVGYASGDVLHPDPASGIGASAGSGFTLTVHDIGPIGANSTGLRDDHAGTNIGGPPGTAGGWPSPLNAKVSYYSQNVLGLTGETDGVPGTTPDDYINAFIDTAASKWNRANWNASYVIPTVNNFIRTQFGLPTISPLWLPDGVIGTAYNQTVSATGGTAPYTFTIDRGTLPAPLSLNPSTGAITGTPTTYGSSTFVVKAVDSSASPVTGYQEYLIRVFTTGGVVITISPSTLSGGTVGLAYPTTTFTASGGTGPYTWSSSPSPPFPGVTLNSSTGVMTGTPTVANSSTTFTITATDSLSASGSQAYTINIAAPSTAPISLMGAISM